MTDNEHIVRHEDLESGALVPHATENDSAHFIHIASRLITSAAAANGWPWIYAVHIDRTTGRMSLQRI
ncbi:MAG: hypothetical protein O2856_09260 [Planctomycetota bacterium]|nr:hypothetical protein [Planctomycetota bacterium]